MTGQSPEVAVLLCTFNGGRFLDAQLQSLFQQSYPASSLYVSDDGSTDDTLELLEKAILANLPLRIDLRRGPGKGAVTNFLSLVCEESISGDYFAYADQDDIWDTDKLSRAVTRLAKCDASLPALYCARTRSLSESGLITGASPQFRKPPSFPNALVHNIGGGNTMVMNRAARELLCRAGLVDVVSHDWWTYLMVSGAGGKVEFDQTLCLNYRQHADNQIGANTGFKRRMMRYFGALSGRNRDWNDRNIAALEQNATLLTQENRERLKVFSESRGGGVFDRLRGVRRAGLYAQTFSGNLGLLLATLLKKI